MSSRCEAYVRLVFPAFKKPMQVYIARASRVQIGLTAHSR